jgi:putative transposase
MQINRAYRYELKPNKAQREHLEQHADVARFAYNWALERCREALERGENRPNAIELHRIWNRWKKENAPWVYEVSKCAPQEAFRDMDRAFQHFLNGRKQGRRIGFPKFRRKGKDDRFRLTGTIRVGESWVQLPRLGRIRLKEKPKVLGCITSATVKREADRWYVSLTVEQEIPEPEPVSGPVVGVDVGLTCFLALSDGTKIYAPKPLEQYLRRLRQRSRQHSRKRKGSSNRRDSALRLARLHRRIRNIRRDFLHKITTELAKTRSVIVLEDLSVQGMMQNGKLARAIADAGWREFRKMLEYKTRWYGSQLVVAPRFYPSSKRCSACGYVMGELPFFIREWCCPECGIEHDRDINAARNLRDWYLSTVSSTGIYACGDGRLQASAGARR